MDDEREYLPLSWLSQACYCLRRAGLLMNEQVWMENEDTAKGRNEHQKVHTQRIERRGTTVNLYEYEVFSARLGLHGKCDCIEATADEKGCQIQAVDFPVRLYPVEYKHGTVRDEPEYKLQLCAQAMCLEERYHTEIPEGALYFISAHRRLRVPLDSTLRKQVEEMAQRLRDLRMQLRIPPAAYGPKCRRCSLQEYCMPKTKVSAQSYCRTLKAEAEEVCAL